MEFYDPPRGPVPVTWWFCEDKAKVYPGYTRFASGNWASDKFGWPGPGEILGAPRPWSDGEPPGPNPIDLPDWTFVEGFTAAANSRTSTVPLDVPKDTTILVGVWSFTNTGPGVITSVTDTAGNVYTPDFQRKHPTDPRVQLTWWRTLTTADAIGMLWTVNFPGGQEFVSFQSILVKGLKDAGPIITKGQTGSASEQPRVDSFPSVNGPKLIVGSFSCGSMSALTTLPPGFTEVGRWVSNGAQEDGSTVTLIDEGKKKKYALRWEATIHYAWVAVGLVYAGVPKERMPAKKFCGSPKVIAEGGNASTPEMCTDEFGFSACCFDFKQHLRCCDFLEDLPDGSTMDMVILAVHHPNTDTFAFPGFKVRMQFVPGIPLDYFWISDIPTIGGGFVSEFSLACISTYWLVQPPPSITGDEKVHPALKPWALSVLGVDPCFNSPIAPVQPERWDIAFQAVERP